MLVCIFVPLFFFFYGALAHRNLPVPPHSFPTRRSSDLIGAWLALLSALAFAAQGLLPLDPRDLESDASRMHATMWTLWWVALLPAAVLLAFGSRARGPSRALGAARVTLAVVIVLLALMPLALLAPAVAQPGAFAAWLAWVIAAGWRDRTGVRQGQG